MPRYTYHCPVRWSDMDSFQHINNARFLTLYEEARVALMFSAATEAGVPTLAEGIVIARHEIDYLRPVAFGVAKGGEPRTVRIDMWIDRIGNASFTVAYELYDDGQLAGRARSVLVPYDVAEGRPRRLAPAEREYLAVWRDDRAEPLERAG